MQHTVLIEDLAVVLCIAAVVTVLCQKIKQPIVLGYLIAGIIIGPYTPPFSFIDDEAEIRLLAELGVIFLMFSLGLEFTFSRLTRLGLPAFIIGFFEVIAMLIIGFFTGRFLGWPPYESLLLGAALSISSTTIIVKALEEFKLKRFSFAELVVGILLIEDLLAILLMVYVSTISTTGSIFSPQILFTFVKLLLAITSWFLIGYFVLPYIMRKIQNYINHETLTIISVGLCLFLSAIAVYFGYSAALGAFIMGSILAETPLVQKIAELTLPIRDIFAAVFFVSVGMLIDPMVIVTHWDFVLLLSLTTIFGKILTTGMGSLLAGQSISDSIKIGFSMAQIGEFSFIIIGIGSTMKITDGNLYPIIVGISAITTFVTPYLIKFGLKISDKVEQFIPQKGLDLQKRYQKWWQLHRHAQKYSRYKTFIIRFIINGLIVSFIAIGSAEVLIPRFFPIVNQEWPFQFLFWLIISLVASPFIWAMLFASPDEQTIKSKVAQGSAWLFALAEFSIIAWLFFAFPLLIIPLALILWAYFKLFFYAIKTFYFRLEKILIYNLSRKYEIDKEKMDSLYFKKRK